MTLDILLQESESKIQAIARKMVRSYRLSREDQEDLCSAMRLRLFSNYDKIDFSRPEVGAYTHYMITNAARSELVNRILKHKNNNVVSLDSTPSFDDYDGETLANMIPDPRVVTEEQIFVNKVRDQVLAVLNPKHRKMVEMHLAGITNKEIAERVLHKNGRPYTPDYVAYLLSIFRNEMRRRIRPTENKHEEARAKAGTKNMAPGNTQRGRDNLPLGSVHLEDHQEDLRVQRQPRRNGRGLSGCVPASCEDARG